MLEERLGTALFVKRGRRLELTAAGRHAYEYAQDIFSLGAELEDSIRNFSPVDEIAEFRIGVADSVPKTIACFLIEPATQLPDPVRIICREWKLDSLLTELSEHRLDLVIADAPIPPSVSVRAYNHRLGTSGISFFAASTVRRKLKKRFPDCLNDAPMLMPGQDNALRDRLDRWCQSRSIRPNIVGEFDDSALMKAFGQRGAGVFVGTTVIAKEIENIYNVRAIGATTDIIEDFYAISVERRVTHPCVVAIAEAAKHDLLAV